MTSLNLMYKASIFTPMSIPLTPAQPVSGNGSNWVQKKVNA